jgi:hypothetical protein
MEIKVMSAQEINWYVKCDQPTFERCKDDEKFAYIVTLARVVNAIYFVYSAISGISNDDSPGAKRDRFNSYLFGSAIMYEGLALIRKMNQPFFEDALFQNGLRLLLKDKTAQQIERAHLNPARHGAVFHFDPNAFAEVIGQASCEECPFVSGRGSTRKGMSYQFADIIAGEILIGFAANTEEFYSALEHAMVETNALLNRFTGDAEELISQHLSQWGFKRETSVFESPASLDNPLPH